MRNDTDMMTLILDVARNDERVRAVIMNGSRTDPNAPKDCFQDYDIVYVVNDMSSFIHDHQWIDVYGERIMLQMPEAQVLLPPKNDGAFNYLMLLSDGNRIDLTLIPIDKKDELIEDASLTIVLLDKDGIIPNFSPPIDKDYHVTLPTDKLFEDCCNEFWWVLQNVAKGIWRDELPYAMKMQGYGRDMLDQMVSWWVGIQYDFEISTGKFGKYFKKYLSKKHWEMYRCTYSDSNYENLWQSVFVACDLFRLLAIEVAEQFHYTYPLDDDRKMTEYLKHVRALSADAKEIY
jgi:aminoglycoside 6-adenylyltransferase